MMNTEVLFKLGQRCLKEEQILVALDYSIMFTCLDDLANRYIALCLDYDNSEYLVALVDNQDLVKMLKKDITMRHFFRNLQNVFLITVGDSFEEDVIVNKTGGELVDDELPVKGAYFEIKSEDIEAYKEKLARQIRTAISITLNSAQKVENIDKRRKAVNIEVCAKKTITNKRRYNRIQKCKQYQEFFNIASVVDGLKSIILFESQKGMKYVR